ncbi:MAG: molybdopterin-guanine dinucleotide biosynthesis protein B [Clostridia bacterium]|nr:molybdopterin-guanine dinucleotide biosynthesis protein B [Clostridia bacterium]MDY5555210.1 molybdopterin-guanine dinucleotide biosynthesis protein B [Blautia sp.]
MDVVKKPFVVAVSGVKNSGKTTFIEKLIPVLKRRGYLTAVIKHDGHQFDPDVMGTDTWRVRKAGAYATGIFSSDQWMIVKKEPHMDENRLAEFFPEADIILIEGLKNSDYPKFEIVRKSISQKSVCKKETLLGLVTDTDISISGVASLGIDEPEIWADVLEDYIRKKN